MVLQELYSIFLILQPYRNGIHTIYIDPPYNTNASSIIYKNHFKHSSWCSLIENKITNSNKLLSNDGFFNITIDYAEFFNLAQITDKEFGEKNRVGIVTIFINPKEVLAYPVLDEITGGAERGYRTKEANLNQMYITHSGYGYYKRWSKNVVEGYFLRSTPVIHFLNAMPEYREAFEEMTKHGEQVLSSIVKYDEIRMKLVEDIKKIFVDVDANFETDFVVLDDRQEQLFQDLKANPEKINTLKTRSIEIQEEPEKMSRAKALNPLRKTLREELDSIIEPLKLVKEV